MLQRHRLMVIVMLVSLLGTIASGCAAGETDETNPDTPNGESITVTITDPPDELEPIVVPTMPDYIIQESILSVCTVCCKRTLPHLDGKKLRPQKMVHRWVSDYSVISILQYPAI
jgi:hypothetical protein